MFTKLHAVDLTMCNLVTFYVRYIKVYNYLIFTPRAYLKLTREVTEMYTVCVGNYIAQERT